MKREPMYFDIETVPSQLPGIREELASSITPPANYSKADTIAKWEAETKPGLIEEAYLKTSFDGGLGQICVIGWAIGDEEPHAYRVDDLSHASERQVLEDFFCAVTDAGSGTQFIGHNIIGFDLPFIWKRAMVLGVKPPWIFPRNPKPWGEAVADTMLLWDGQQKAGGSMDRICRLMGIPGKGGISGADVWPMVKDGRIAEVADYCKGDVARTRAIYRRMNFLDVPTEAAPAAPKTKAPAVNLAEPAF